MLAVVFLVELVAAARIVESAWLGRWDGVAGLSIDGWPWYLTALVVAGVVSTEATLGVERIRHRSDASSHIHLSSVWSLAAAVVLPGLLACVVVVILYAHIHVRVWRHAGVPAHRALFSAATVVLAVYAAGSVIKAMDVAEPFRSGAGLVAVLLAVLAYAAVGLALVLAVTVLGGPGRKVQRLMRALRRTDDAVLEVAALSMGALVAGAMVSFGPAHAVLVLPPLVVLHRAVLVRQLEEAASIDSKTGLLNSAAWHVRAGRALRRSGRAGATVLVLDLDHFKRVNDRHGHLIGDRVLAAVAAAVRAEVRDDDLVGRFGGEEFVVLLHGTSGDRTSAAATAERIRACVADLRIFVDGGGCVAGTDDEEGTVVHGLTVSIGGATFPVDGIDLSRLVEVADAAMYSAKDAGRNTVQIGLLPDSGSRGTGRMPHLRR